MPVGVNIFYLTSVITDRILIQTKQRSVRQIDHDNRASLANVNVRRAVLSRREKTAQLKPAVRRDGWHWNDNLSVGLLRQDGSR